MPLTAKVHALGTTKKGKDGKTDEPCKGNLSVYGLNSQFPITLYANQWQELGKVMPAILKMVEAGLKDGTMAGPQEKSTASGDRIILK